MSVPLIIARSNLPSKSSANASSNTTAQLNQFEQFAKKEEQKKKEGSFMHDQRCIFIL